MNKSTTNMNTKTIATTVVNAKPTYKKVSKNICKTGKTYRVRVCGESCTCYTQKAAFAIRKEMLAKNAK